MKKILSCLLSLAITASMITPALPARAAGTVTPEAPSWVEKDEYFIFTEFDSSESSSTDLYLSQNWKKIKALRNYAEKGGFLPTSDSDPEIYNLWQSLCNGMGDGPAVDFERFLLTFKFYSNHPSEASYTQLKTMSNIVLGYDGIVGTQRNQILGLWGCRALAAGYTTGYLTNGVDKKALYQIDNMLMTTSYSLNDLYENTLLDHITQAQWNKLTSALTTLQQNVSVSLDGNIIANRTAGLVEAKNGRTMLPLYIYSDKLGCDIGWSGEDMTVTVKRAGTEILMTIGSTTALVDGTPVEMDVAPYIRNDRTMLPAAYVSQFFGQNIRWDEVTRTVHITEDKSVAGSSNLEQWALPMSAMLDYINYNSRPTYYLRIGNDSRFGGMSRGYESNGMLLGTNDKSLAQASRDLLNRSWSITSREDLISTVLSMTYSGHNSSFLYDAALVNSLTKSEYKQLLNNAAGMDTYMWPYTKELSEKWGDRGILCWDLFRMSNLVQWGYNAGYVTYAEALVLLEPAATLLKENFSSWDEAYENYLDGYNWWARNNVLETDIWETERGQYYLTMKAQDELFTDGKFFDDHLFDQKIIPVPDLTIDDILNTL